MHHVATFNIRSHGKTLKFIFFVIRVYDEKLGHILEPLVAKYRPDVFAPLRDIAEKTGPREPETDSRSSRMV